MLNYVWMGLLFLGIGVALTTDIIDQSTNKYRNGDPLGAEFIFEQPFDKKSDSTIPVKVKVRANDFSKFYEQSVIDDIICPAEISKISDTGDYSFILQISEKTPDVWQKIAKASGEENDITGTIVIKSYSNLLTAEGSVTLEELSFAKMKDVTNSAIDYAGVAVKIAIGLIGIMALWLGIMKIAEEAGLITIIANAVRPITKFLFPKVPHDHPAIGAMIMNISANMLGLGNAATPFGLKAMEELDKLNDKKGTATNAMCTFLAINTAGLTLIPATAIAIRAAAGSSDPAIIIGTSFFGALCATTVGIISAKFLEKFPIKNGGITNWIKQNIKAFVIMISAVILFAIFMLTGLMSQIFSMFSFIDAGLVKSIVQGVSTLAIPLIILIFVLFGMIKKIKIYEVFVEGAKEGFNIAVRIIPFLVAMLVAIGIFRAGGALDFLILILDPATSLIGFPAEALPMALMRPLSGSGSLGIMAEIISVHGPDSFIGVLVSTIMGSTETTFYVIAVYFGAVNIRRTRHALAAGLLADLAGILGALFIVKLLFG